MTPTPTITEALAPLAAYIAEHLPRMAQVVDAYNEWGLVRLEALANGYIDETAS